MFDRFRILSCSLCPSWFKHFGLAQWMLLVVALVEAMLCLEYHEQRWDAVIGVQGLPPEHEGEGLVIQWNGLGYYAWLRSLLIDGDWDFDNEFDEHNLYHHYVPPPAYRTPLDRRANQWSVGPACLWAVTVVPGHFLLKGLHGSIGPWAADGYSLPYQVLVGATSFAVTLAGLAFLYGICRTQARPGRAALAAALLTLGTTIVYFNAIEISLPHGIGTAVLAALVWYWLTTYGSVRPGRWLLVGVLMGTAALVRWQLATFAVLPAGEALLVWRRGRLMHGRVPHPQPLYPEGRGEKRIAPHPQHLRSGRRGENMCLLVMLAVVGAVLIIWPQLIAWRCVYGRWLVNPIQGVTYHWLHPSLWTILCSQDRSLFYWTPLALLACLGAIGCLWPTRRAESMSADDRSVSPKEPLWILAIAFYIQVYALAGMWGKGELLERTGNFAGVFLARSFGFRDLTESLVVLAPGLAWLLEQAPPRWFRVLTTLGLVLVTWNLVLVGLYTNGLLPSTGGASPSLLWTQAIELVQAEPFTLLQALEGPLLIGALLALAEHKQQPAPSQGGKVAALATQ